MAPARAGPRVRDVDRGTIEQWAAPTRKLREYCRLHVEGIENIPEGPAILAANHTGWSGLDYALLFLTLYDDAHRTPRVAVHPTYFRLERIRQLAEQLGFYEVSVSTSTKILDEGGLIAFFPEAEAGNFKPIWKRYQLQPYRPGFARVALASMAPIVPVVIIGGEEANPTLGSIRLDKLDLPIPIPLSILPLPVKWRIKILPPIDPSQYLEADAPDKDVAAHIARDIQKRMQAEIHRQLELRGNPFF